MQKTQKHPAAGKAAAGKTGKTGKAGKTDTRKPLTPEQRERKNKHDRERRARIREAQRRQGKTTGDQKQDRQGRCPSRGCQKGCCGPRHSLPKPPEPAASFFEDLGRRLVELARSRPEPVVVEPGVTRHTVSLPYGRKVTVTVVDGERVDPLSRYNPIPWPVRRGLLLARMAREISDIVDARTAALS